MLPEYFIVIGSLVTLSGGLVYTVATLRNKTRPNRMSWALWAIVPTIIYIAQISRGEQASWLALAELITPYLTLIATYIRHNAYTKLTRLNIFCALLALTGLVLWFLSNNPLYAILFAILADASAAIPTVVKTVREPETENAISYIISAVGCMLVFLAVSDWGINNWLFVAYSVLVNAVVGILALRKTQPTKRKLGVCG